MKLDESSFLACEAQACGADLNHGIHQSIHDFFSIGQEVFVAKQKIQHFCITDTRFLQIG